MGAAASIGNDKMISEDEAKVLLGGLFVQSIFDSLKENGDSVSAVALQKRYSERTDVFLTHDWGKELGVSNHDRVRSINEKLKQKGMTTWFDEEKMEGNVRQKMVTGIDNAGCILVFVTKRYMEKVGGTNTEDNCFLEFDYASRRKTASKMIAVVMEQRMCNTSEWAGLLGMTLGGRLYVDFSDYDESNASSKIDELFSKVLAVNGTTLQLALRGTNIIPAEAAAVAAAASDLVDASPPPSTAAVDSDHVLHQRLVDWFVEHIQSPRATADRYAAALLQAGIGSIAKLSRKLARDRTLLARLLFDEDDVDDISCALLPADTDQENAIETEAVADERCGESPAAGEDADLSEELRMELLELGDLGFTVAQFLAKGITVRQLRQLFPHYSLEDFLSAGCSLDAVYAAGYSPPEALAALVSMGLGISRLLELQLDVPALLGQFPAADLLAAGVSPTALLGAGVGLDTLRAAGCSGERLRAVGMEASRLLAAGFPRNEAYSVEEMRAKGLTLAQLKNNAGFSAAQLHAAGFSVEELLGVGCSVAEFKAGGVFLATALACTRSINAITEVTCVLLLADKRRVLCAGEDKVVRVFDTEKGKCLLSLAGHGSWVTCLADLQDGVRVVSGSEDRALRVWDLGTGKSQHVLTDHTRGVTCCGLVSAERAWLASGSYDMTIKLWDYARGAVLRTFSGHSETVNCVCALSASGLLASGGNDRTLRLWSLKSAGDADKHRRFEDKAGKGIVCLADVVDGVLSGAKSGEMKLWSLQGAVLRVFSGHKNGVCAVLQLQENFLLSSSRDKTIKVWQLDSGECVCSLDTHSDWVPALSAQTAGGVVFVSGSKDKTLRVWS